MLNLDTKMFLQSPDNSDNYLYPATIVEADSSNSLYSAVPDEEAEFGSEQSFSVETGQEILVYHEVRGEFMKQSACIEEIRQSESGPAFCFITTSDLVSAENRQCYRTSTVISEIFADFGPEQNVPLLDISANGFAVVSLKQYKIGNIVDVVLYYEDQQFSGTGCVQSVKELSKGRFRYGLLGANDVKPSDNLKKKGLAFISTAVQRMQLQRLAGTL